jgi:hypothetical protein
MKAKTKPLNCSFAILEIKGGRDRQRLERVLDNARKNNKLPPMLNVTIQATITGVHGHYDGIGQEFTLDVSDVKLTEFP